MNEKQPLHEEIFLLRQLLRRLFQHSGEAVDIRELSRLLESFGRAAVHVSRLLLAQQELARQEGASQDANALADRALQAVWLELEQEPDSHVHPAANP